MIFILDFIEITSLIQIICNSYLFFITIKLFYFFIIIRDWVLSPTVYQ